MLELLNNAVFGLVVFWTIVLLYGLLRDGSIRSRIIRIVLIGIIWSAAPHGSWFSFGEYTAQFSRSYPAWVIVLAALLIPVYILGFVKILREKRTREVI